MKRHIADKEGTGWFSSYQYTDEEEEEERLFLGLWKLDLLVTKYH
jgi:hypothetical protein